MASAFRPPAGYHKPYALYRRVVDGRAIRKRVMAVLKIARLGHPVLLQPAAAIGDPSDPELHRLVRDMIETLADAGGVGLAAPQVHTPHRLIHFHVPAERAAPASDGAWVPMTDVMNTILTPLGPDRARHSDAQRKRGTERD